VQAGATGIVAATLAAVACVALGEGQPPNAKTEAVRAAASRPPETAGEPAPVDAGRSLQPTSIDPPAPPGSTSPALTAESPTPGTKEHEVLMTWLAPGESGGRLMFARLSGQAWSQPITVAEHVSTLGPADRPSLTVIDTQAVRRTLIARTGDVVALSGDGGRTWTRLPAPALPFASFAGGDEGAYVFWLAADGDGSAKLLGTRVLAGETLLDPRVAGGSGTSAAMTWDGPVVVYRDRSAEGGQDIAMVRHQDAQWTLPRPVHVEGWSAVQEPQSGPHVAALRRQVAVAWSTEAQHRPRVLVTFSSDAGRTFGAPVEVDARESDHAPWGSVDVALDDNGHALVLWMATTGPSEATLNLARVSADGKRGEELVLAQGPPARFGGIPQIARAGDRVAVTWIEAVPTRLHAVAVPLAGIPAPGSRRPGPAAASGGPSRPYAGRGRVGEPAPDLELVALNGDKVSLASLRGRAVVLNLWATWCVPCLAEMPELATLQGDYGGKGLVVVGVSVDSADASAKVRAFVADRKIPFAVWLDPEMRVYHALRVQGLPATFVIDREGRIVLRRDRAIAANDPELRKALSRALSDS
jgi:peroxiredoxin